MCWKCLICLIDQWPIVGLLGLVYSNLRSILCLFYIHKLLIIFLILLLPFCHSFETLTTKTCYRLMNYCSNTDKILCFPFFTLCECNIWSSRCSQPSSYMYKPSKKICALVKSYHLVIWLQPTQQPMMRPYGIKKAYPVIKSNWNEKKFQRWITPLFRFSFRYSRPWPESA